MSEEEQEAIEYIKAFQKDLYGASEKNLMAIYIDRVWNYIDKLQKENEELQLNLATVIYSRDCSEKDYISKDKIREKIKELEEDLEKEMKEVEDFTDFNAMIPVLMTERDTLKELLEEN